ncbi:MAG: alkaline phosphatase [Acidobacteria bacterium]|nr:alkaline phosphatase [Acidobacteriota bacterium]
MKNQTITKLTTTVFLILTAIVGAAQTARAQSAPTLRIVLPERFRVITNQYFDLRVEAEGISHSTARVLINVEGEGGIESLNFAGANEITTDNDNNPLGADKAWTYRRVSFSTPGIKTVSALVIDGRRVYGVATQISVQNFNLVGQKSIVLFIGDAMGTAYRDASRIVSQSTANRFREGWFDELQQMDKMPVTGMSMTYSLENIVPDSANTGSAWTTGNKTINGALNVFPDNNDFKYNSANQQATKQFALDNPRVETLWQFLKRRHGYKTGIVTTSDVADATPAAEGAHTITRSLLKDIARQYVDGSINSGNQFDVIMGGGLEHFNARTVANSGDTRNLVTELQAAGYTYVQNRNELNAITTPPAKILGLFRTGNMNVAYDKLLLNRPPDEPMPNFGGFTNQPYLDEMTAKAIDTLKQGNAPFILMVEGASIDKQSHPNYAAGQIWDNIELDKSVAVGRAFLNTNAQTLANTLVLCTADHDQSLSIIGAVDTQVPNAIQNVISTLLYPNANRGQGNVGIENRVGETQGFPDYQDANGDRYPENTNRIRIKVGYRTGDHTGSSVPVTAEGTGALLFYGYFDQTDIFFKMAKTLSMNTQPLDEALNYKRSVDVPYFTPAEQFRLKNSDGTIWMKNAPLHTPRLITEQDHADHDDEHKAN